jgi:ribonuclease J
VVYHSLVPTGKRVVEGSRTGSTDDPVLKNRRKISEFGLVIVTLVLDKKTFFPLSPPTVSVLGVHYADEADLTREVEEIVALTCEGYASTFDGVKTPMQNSLEELRSIVKTDIRSLFRHTINRRPLIEPQIVLLDPEKFPRPRNL